MLKTNRTFTHLYLPNNQLGDRAAQILANTLPHHNSSLAYLSLVSNKSINDSSVDSFFDIFKYNQSLTQLWLSDCSLSDPIKTRLQGHNKTKEELHIVGVTFYPAIVLWNRKLRTIISFWARKVPLRDYLGGWSLSIHTHTHTATSLSTHFLQIVFFFFLMNLLQIHLPHLRKMFVICHDRENVKSFSKYRHSFLIEAWKFNVYNSFNKRLIWIIISPT